ncbi:MAG TPA: TfoX/Sxy family protein [Steroidobacteraceae bacterium]|nr:TfoX/Sxy family protein [Steroidobacteraceae bacterium]
MAVSANFLSYVIDQLTGLGAVRTRRMFGGIGLYCDDLFFGLIDDDVVYFKVDDSNRTDYTSRGSKAFRPVADDPNAVSMSYFNLPEDILEDSDEVRRWARKSVVIAAAAAAAATVKAAKKNKNKKSTASRKATVRAAKKATARSKRNDIATASTSHKPRASRRSRLSKA